MQSKAAELGGLEDDAQFWRREAIQHLLQAAPASYVYEDAPAPAGDGGDDDSDDAQASLAAVEDAIRRSLAS